MLPLAAVGLLSAQYAEVAEKAPRSSSMRGNPGTALRGGARRGAVGSVVIADPVRDLSMSTLDDV